MNPVILSVGGGKGGIGKSLIAANLGLVLARLEHPTLVVDADLGGSDLHNILGLENQGPGLGEMLTQRGLTFDKLIRPVLEPRFFYVPGDACLPAATNPRFQKKRKLFHDLSKVKQSFVLLDLGAGSSITITDFFLCSPFSLLVMNPERAAELNAFNFLKNLVYRLLAPLARDNAGVARALEAFQQRQQGPGSKAMAGLLARLDTKFYQQVQGRLKNLHTKLVLNRLRNIDEFVQARQVQAWAGEDLGLNLEIMGFLPEDQAVIEAAHQGLPVMDLDPGAPFCRALALLGLKLGIWAGKSRQWQEYVNTKDSFTRTATEFARFFSSR